MGHVGRHEDEVAGAGLGHELEPLAPAHARLTAHDVDHALELAVMVGAGFRVGWIVTVPAHSFCAPAVAVVIAAARFMPGVCGVLVSSSRRVDDPDAVVLPAFVAHADLVRPPRSVAFAGSSSRMETSAIASLDHERLDRTGVPEVVFAAGKTGEQNLALIRALHERAGFALATRVPAGQRAALQAELPAAVLEPHLGRSASGPSAAHRYSDRDRLRGNGRFTGR